MAPELVKHEYYNDNADLWSLGILLYEMLHGFPPFKGRVQRDTISKILGNRLRFARNIKEDARDVIEVILNLDSDERPTVCQILDSPWGRRMAVELNSPKLIFERTDKYSDENETTFAETPTNIQQTNCRRGKVFEELENKTGREISSKSRRSSIEVDNRCKL
jgi:serine/threonine protein kinase